MWLSVSSQWLLSHLQSLRILRYDPSWVAPTHEFRVLPNACLMQERDTTLYDTLTVVTRREPDGGLSPGSPLHRLLEFGQIAVRQVKSNSVVIVGATPDGSLRLLGMGAGQPNRVVSTKLAIDRARATLAAEAGDANVEAFVREGLGQALLLSEAFFPFPDSVDAAAEAGILTIVQPGGSIRDSLVFARCDELAVAMVTTGIRHFKH